MRRCSSPAPQLRPSLNSRCPTRSRCRASLARSTICPRAACCSSTCIPQTGSVCVAMLLLLSTSGRAAFSTWFESDEEKFFAPLSSSSMGNHRERFSKMLAHPSGKNYGIVLRGYGMPFAHHLFRCEVALRCATSARSGAFRSMDWKQIWI